jgi:hypothetical protein
LLSVLLLITLPESVRYMVAKGYPVEKIRATLWRLSRDRDRRHYPEFRTIQGNCLPSFVFKESG